MDFFCHLYYAKKAILMLENLDNNFERVSKIYKKFANSIHHAEDMRELTNLAENYEKELRELIPEDIYEEWDYGDYEVYTDKFHHRKFWNEIENHKSINAFLDRFLEVYYERPKKENFAVSIYDFNNYDITFEKLEDMEEFIEKYDIIPYTAFGIIDGEWYELYSE